MKRILFIFTAFLLIMANPAHAFKTLLIMNGADTGNLIQRLVSSSPYDTQLLDQPPDAITLNFTNPILTDKSFIKIYDLYDSQLNTNPVTVNGNSMSAALPALPSGKYRVKWKATCQCADTEALDGIFHFTIR